MELAEREIVVADQFNELNAYEPKLVPSFVPKNAAEQKQAFIGGNIRNPNHVYHKLQAIDFPDRTAEISRVGGEILQNPNLNPKHAAIYEQFVNTYLKKTRLMELAHIIKTTDNLEEKEAARREFMELNIELYGEPDVETYRSLLQEKLSSIKQKNLTGAAAAMRDELFALVDYNESVESSERFKPEPETVEWLHEVVDALYGGMLSHVSSEQDNFTRFEIQQVFQTIIEQEFGEAATGWRVDIEPANSVNTIPLEKRIVIPDDYEDIDASRIRELIVHEIGIHMLRAVIGEETDMRPLVKGLDGYYDAEEGLGKIMEQALHGLYQEARTSSYITAGLAYFDNKDFRDIYEIQWRIEALLAADDTGEIPEKIITDKKEKVYGTTSRIMRGTDELPWFKDLAYYNGSAEMWRYLESIRGDDIKFMFVLLGKINPADITHERIVYEAKTV